ncbi:universal stress protein [Fodinicola feengrottensis]|uniref:universal stress protein n=1 Tax=Fodinicola feengrottensis TaxID=435914 RepID=UPI0013D653FF|nr:universal stress protein [Fodinicola feengrottensis]
MRVLAWLTDNTWEACVDAVRTTNSPDVTLLYVQASDVSEATHGAFSGLLGRHRPGHDPGDVVRAASAATGDAVLSAAVERLGFDCRVEHLAGAVERVVVATAADADLLVVARDGDRSRLGPRSLGHATRFVVDHAPCSVMLIWPEEAPDLGSIPPKPPHPPRR